MLLKGLVVLLLSIVFVNGCEIHPIELVLPEGWQPECRGKKINYYQNILKFELSYVERQSKRCEITNRQMIQLNEPFILTFTLEASRVDYLDDQWHSILQIHSFPDLKLGEKWRCPISALEVYKGELRMFNRWDSDKVSITNNGTCANQGNSISSRRLFSGYRIERDKAYNVVIKGVMSYSKRGRLTVIINNEVLADIKGPNAFNDIQGPFVKYGIYKPTSWKGKQTLKYSYSNMDFVGGKNGD